MIIYVTLSAKLSTYFYNTATGKTTSNSVFKNYMPLFAHESMSWWFRMQFWAQLSSYHAWWLTSCLLGTIGSVQHVPPYIFRRPTLMQFYMLRKSANMQAKGCKSFLKPQVTSHLSKLKIKVFKNRLFFSVRWTKNLMMKHIYTDRIKNWDHSHSLPLSYKREVS